jgi:hypothetical protein
MQKMSNFYLKNGHGELTGICTLNGSVAGGVMGLLMCRVAKRGYYDISTIINSILG